MGGTSSEQGREIEENLGEPRAGMWEAEALWKSCLAGHALTTVTHPVPGGRQGDAREEQL